MSLEQQPKPFVIGFDGLHRAGKGTQAELLAQRLKRVGESSVVMRGDGTRDGLGLTDGDPVSTVWQERSRRLKMTDRTVESWSEASYLLVQELHARINSDAPPNYILVDRTILSRTAFMLHRGVLKLGRRATYSELYPDASRDTFPIEDSVPDVLFDMRVDDPEVLLRRLDAQDPKYDFRAQNIRGGFDAARKAKDYVPAAIADRIEVLDAMQSVETIHRRIIRTLGVRAAKASTVFPLHS